MRFANGNPESLKNDVKSTGEKINITYTAYVYSIERKHVCFVIENDEGVCKSSRHETRDVTIRRID